MSKLVYYLTYAGFWLIAILPFPALYVLSDIFCFFLYRIARYRVKVVRTNLRNSFPHKSAAELKMIERRFYRYLCDYMLESEKTLRLTPAELLHRMTFHNKELYLRLVEERGGIVLMMPHYGNFEWVMGMGLYMKPEDLPVQVYKPVRNPYIDKMLLQIRSRFRGYNIPKHNTVREVIRLKRAGKKFALGLITDQSPGNNEFNYWTTFLNQDTCFMDGGERIAKITGFPVVYCDIRKTRRGYCEGTFTLLAENPAQTKPGEITGMFAQAVEKTIHRDPAYWLWSHKRWKHKRT